MKTFTDDILERFGKDFFNGRTIYDIGCHNFEETQKFVGLGARVVGIDKSVYAEVPKCINFIQEDFLQWKPSEPIDILFIKNVALFIESSKVFQKIFISNPKMIIVQTMYDFPDPNWPLEVLKKLYFTRAEDWFTFFEKRGYKTIYAKNYESTHCDLNNNKRTFKLVDYIAKKI